MFCTRCGRQLPQDGSPCVCGSGEAEKINFEPMYAPPPYAMQHSPLTEAIRSVMASPVFLIAALFMTVNLILSAVLLFVPMDYYAFFSSVVPLLDAIEPGLGNEFLREMESAVGDLYSAQMQSALSGLTGLIGPGLTVASFWMIFASAKDPYGPKTSGLTILQVLQIIGIVGLGLAALLSVFLVVLVIALTPMLIEELYYYGITLPKDAPAMIMAAAIAIAVVLILCIVFAIIFASKSLNSVVRAKKAIRTGVVHKGASRFVMVFCFIAAAVNVMNVYGTIQQFGVLYGVSNIVAGLANLFLALTIIRYNKAVKPFLASKYEQFPVQPDVPPYGRN